MYQLLTTLCHFTVGISAMTPQRMFHIVADPKMYIISLPNLDSRPRSLVSCAVSCTGLNPRCYSFLYDAQKRLCKYGSGTVAKNALRNVSSELLFVVASCDADKNYLLESIEHEAICFWLSKEDLQYDNAVETCKEKGLRLISLRSVSKMDVFVQLAARYFHNDAWIGLDDKREEGKFRWVDDESILPQTFFRFMFYGDEPNNRGNEDCITYTGHEYIFNDLDCTRKKPFVCEVTMTET